MKRRFAAAVGRMSEESASAFFICFAAFAAGCVAGTVFSGMIPENGMVSEYFSGLFGQYESGGRGDISTFSVIVSTYGYHLLVFFFGFSLLGTVLIPITAVIRGFLLAFSVSILVRLYSGEGITLALSTFGATALIAIPCFLVMSVMAFSARKCP